jgi:hypothetical protein
MGLFETTLLVLAVSLLIGGFAISVGAKLAFKSENYTHAVVTALLGALAWALVSAAFSVVGVQGALSSLVGLVVWVWVVRRRYEVGWTRGSFIGLFAWLAALVVLSLLALFGIDSLSAYGVPGV